MATNDELVRKVSARIDKAIRENRRIETVLIIILISLAATGLALLLLGAIRDQLTITIPGGICGLLIVFPIRSLMRLREWNIRFTVFPQLLNLAESDEERKEILDILLGLLSRIEP